MYKVTFSDPSAQSSGAVIGDDAMPFKDLAEAITPRFEVGDDGVKLLGSISQSSGTVYFPARQVSQEGGKRDLSPVAFGPYGTLYSYSTVHLSSTRPTPYTIGYVDFDNGARVLAEVKANPSAPLGCDIPVELRADDGQWFVVPVQTARGAA